MEYEQKSPEFVLIEASVKWSEQHISSGHCQRELIQNVSVDKADRNPSFFFFFLLNGEFIKITSTLSMPAVKPTKPWSAAFFYLLHSGGRT